MCEKELNGKKHAYQKKSGIRQLLAKCFFLDESSRKRTMFSSTCTHLKKKNPKTNRWLKLINARRNKT